MDTLFDLLRKLVVRKVDALMKQDYPNSFLGRWWSETFLGSGQTLPVVSPWTRDRRTHRKSRGRDCKSTPRMVLDEGALESGKAIDNRGRRKPGTDPLHPSRRKPLARDKFPLRQPLPRW